MDCQNGKGRDVQKLTPAQAKWIEERAHEIARVCVTAIDVYDAIFDLTAKPGEWGYCDGCKHWEARCWFKNYCFHYACLHPENAKRIYSDMRMENMADLKPDKCPIDR